MARSVSRREAEFVLRIYPLILIVPLALDTSSVLARASDLLDSILHKQGRFTSSADCDKGAYFLAMILIPILERQPTSPGNIIPLLDQLVELLCSQESVPTVNFSLNQAEQRVIRDDLIPSARFIALAHLCKIMFFRHGLHVSDCFTQRLEDHLIGLIQPESRFCIPSHVFGLLAACVAVTLPARKLAVFDKLQPALLSVLQVSAGLKLSISIEIQKAQRDLRFEQEKPPKGGPLLLKNVAKVVSNLALHCEAVQVKVRPEINLLLKSALRSKSVSTVISLLQAFGNIIPPLFPVSGETVDQLLEVLKHAGTLVFTSLHDQRHLKPLCSVAITIFRQFKKDEDRQEIFETITESLFKPFAEMGRFAEFRQTSGLRPMSNAEGGDHIASLMYAAVAKMNSALLDEWILAYWGVSNCEDAETLDSLCHAGFHPRLAVTAMQTDWEEIDRHLGTYVRDKIKRLLAESGYQAQKIPELLEARFRQEFTDWSDRQPDATEEEKEEFADEYVTELLRTERSAEYPVLSNAIKRALRSQSAVNWMWQPEDTSQNAQIVSLACPHQEEFSATDLALSALPPPSPNCRRWYHGCDGRKACDRLENHSLQYRCSNDGDFGTGPAWYLFECFSYAFKHAKGKRAVQGASCALQTVPAIFVFDIPTEKLESMPHMVVADQENAKAMIFSSRHQSAQHDDEEPAAKQWDTKVTPGEKEHVFQQLAVLYPSSVCNMSGLVNHRLTRATRFMVEQLNGTHWIFSYLFRFSDKKGTPFTSMRFHEDCQEGGSCKCAEGDMPKCHGFRTTHASNEGHPEEDEAQWQLDPQPQKRWVIEKGLTATQNRIPIGQLVLKSDKAHRLLSTCLRAVLFLDYPKDLDDLDLAAGDNEG